MSSPLCRCHCILPIVFSPFYPHHCILTVVSSALCAYVCVLTIMSLPLCSDPSACQAHHYQSYFFVVTLFHGLLHIFLVTNSVIPVSLKEAIATLQYHSHPSIHSAKTATHPSSVQKLRYQSTMATTKQLLWVLRLSLLLNLIPFSIGLQINSLDPSHERHLCPSGNSPYFPSVPERGVYPLVSGLSIERCGPNLPLISTPEFVEAGWKCLHARRIDSPCLICFCAMFHFNDDLQDMVYALYEIYFRGGDVGRVIGEKMLGDIPLDDFVAHPNRLIGVEILPVQRVNDPANDNTTKDMAWDIHDCLRLDDLANADTTKEMAWDFQECLPAVSGLSLTDEARKDAEEAKLQQWFSDYVQQYDILPSVAFCRLTELSYTTQDLVQSPRDWASKMIRYANVAGIPLNSRLFTVWVRFEPSLRRDIPMPNWTTRTVDFLDYLDEMYPAWIARELDAMFP